MKKFVITIGQLIILFFLGLLAREVWRIYGEQSLTERDAKDAVRVKVLVDRVSSEKKSWRDQLSNSKYVDFHYQGKQYTLRYSQDSVFLQEGILIPVYYSPSNDDFVQNIRGLREGKNYRTSMLVNFTVVRLATNLHTMFALAWTLTILFVIFALGILARLSGIEILWRIQNLISTCCAIILAIYFSYNALGNWRYYSRLKKGVVQQIKAEDIYETKDVNTHYTSDDFMFTVYRARVTFHDRPMLIAVGRKDYEKVHPGEELTVLYDSGLDDMMGANYSPLFADYLFPVVIWAVVLFSIFRRKRRPQSASNGKSLG